MTYITFGHVRAAALVCAQRHEEYTGFAAETKAGGRDG